MVILTPVTPVIVIVAVIMIVAVATAWAVAQVGVTIAVRMDRDLVNQRADRQRRTGALVGTAPGHSAEFKRRVRSRARAAAEAPDGEMVVAHHDLDVAAHVLLVFHRVGPVIVR